MLLYVLSWIVRRIGDIKNSLGHKNSFTYFTCLSLGFPGGSDGKASAYNEGDLGSISGLGRSPGEGNGYPHQYSCLKNAMGREAWQATVHGVTRVGHNLATKPPPLSLYFIYSVLKIM